MLGWDLKTGGVFTHVASLFHVFRTLNGKKFGIYIQAGSPTLESVSYIPILNLRVYQRVVILGMIVHPRDRSVGPVSQC